MSHRACKVLPVSLWGPGTTLASNPGFPSSSLISRTASDIKLEGKPGFNATMALGLGIGGVCWHCCWFPHYFTLDGAS